MSTMSLTWTKFGFSALLAAGLAGCAPGAGDEQEAPTSLLDVKIPEDFTFATTRGFAVRATGDAERIANTLAEVRLPNGELLHRGPLSSPIELAIPTAAQQLKVTLRSPDGERQVDVAVNGPEGLINVE
jgi:hypothetical protein